MISGFWGFGVLMWSHFGWKNWRQVVALVALVWWQITGREGEALRFAEVSLQRVFGPQVKAVLPLVPSALGPRKARWVGARQGVSCLD